VRNACNPWPHASGGTPFGLSFSSGPGLVPIGQRRRQIARRKRIHSHSHSARNSLGPLSNCVRTPYTIQMDGIWMAAMARNIRELRPEGHRQREDHAQSRLRYLGHIDLLVQERLYSNRTDFIRAAIRNQLDRHNDVVKQVVARHQLDLDCGATAGRISKPCVRPARRFTSRSSGSSSLHRASRPASLATPSPLFTCSAPCKPVPQ
jgi:hypothetical protein